MAQLSFTFETPSALLTPDEIFGLDDHSEIWRRLEEGRCWERKPPGFHPKAPGEYLSMWANTVPTGGLIAIGVEDDGTISGCHKLNQNQINALEKAAFVYCSEARMQTKMVPLRAKDGCESFIMLFRDFFREDKVVLDSGGNAFSRIGDSKHKLTEHEVREMQNDKGQIAFEQESCPLDYPSDFDHR
jgi:ATP-dependent DNA helicase RecG